ncbi:MAG: metallophosphoesterase [Acidimicrobiales bacterium]
MKRVLLLLALALLAIGIPAAVANRAYIESYFENRIGAPTSAQTTPIETPVEPVTLRLAVAGDVGTGGAAAYQTAAVMDSLDNQSEYDKLLLLGDNVYDDGDPSLVASKVLDPFAPVLDGPTELLAVLGNHDVDNDNGDAQAAALGMPNRWYVTRTDLATIIALDSTQPDNAEQRAWLRSTLADTETPWTIVMLHHPAFSAGLHGNEPGVQANFVPLFEEYGVDLVLSGHDHDYQRSKVINSVTYVVTGAAAKLRPTGREDFTAVAWSTHSFVDLLIYPDRIQGQAIDHDGQAIDQFTLRAN